MGSRPKLRELQKQVQENVKNMMAEQLQISYGSRRHNPDSRARNGFMKPEFIASCSTFGPEVSSNHAFFLSFQILQSCFSYPSRNHIGLDNIDR